LKNRGKIVILSSVSLLFSGLLTINLNSGIIDYLLEPGPDIIYDPVTIDFLTIQSLVKAVSIKDIPLKIFMEEIDSLNQTWNLKKLRNPFIKISKNRRSTSKNKNVKNRKSNKRPRIKVNGVIWDKAKPFAILNGEIYGVGDKLKGYTVQSISNELVVFYNAKDLFSVKYEKD